MGFIEELRRKQEEKTLRNIERLHATEDRARDVQERLRHSEDQIRLEAEKATRLREQRYEQSKRYLDESNFKNLCEQVSVLDRSVEVVYDAHNVGQYRPWVQGSHLDKWGESRSLIPINDSDNPTLILLHFDKEESYIWHRDIKYTSPRIVITKTKHVVIESRWNGMIIVHGRGGAMGLGGGSTTLPLSIWKNNPIAQENALGRAYNNPITTIEAHENQFGPDAGHGSL